MEVFVERLNDKDGAAMPKYAHDTDAGMDVCATEDIVIAPGETVLVKTGLKVAIPSGYEIQVRPRSGASLKTPLRVANAPGTIDAGYRDEICVIIENTSRDYFWDEGAIRRLEDIPENHHTIADKGNLQGWYDIHKGDRIAQIVLARYERIDFVPVDDVKAIGEDRGGGFGSSGTR